MELIGIQLYIVEFRDGILMAGSVFGIGRWACC